ncbi:glycosyltransferase family 2 protein [Ponticaulis sp.]|uniref:glycosyltransferase family 2 protein n=1 Tax=Ponticaulis sp. TaxID=2020902 RepID=UPI000B70107F|nr:glycosyltransferase family 2 protein [Ponticaulis sp.]MAI91338.1 dolichol-phosphate mannosyltransferase [Ponticaulis sp.]OUX97938.1 MAG: dolichol-phosphate mannosyltransferase [Hyphomonadaceae bacterium TMED5]
MSEAVELSIVVPVHNEEGNAGNLAREIAAALEGRAFEMVFVDDASTDATLDELVAARSELPQLRILSHRKNSGQSRAIRSGMRAARAPIVGTLDGDGQNDPADLPALYRALTRPDAPEKLAMVMGRRASRKDTAWKRFGSRFANNIRQKLLKDGCDDSGCGIKVLKRSVFLELPYFDHMHRYMPALIHAEGYSAEYMDVNHRGRIHGVSKYTNFGRLGAAVSDLRGVTWLMKRRRLPDGVDEV